MQIQEVISSLQNPKVKQVVKWRDRGPRDRDQVILLEGYRALVRALAGGYPITEVFICRTMFQGKNEDALLKQLSDQGAQIYSVAPPAFAKMAYRDRPEGLLGVGPQFHHGLDEFDMTKAAPFYLIAEQIEKPGNLGTMMRSADAANVDGLILCDSKTDLFNPNVVRASTGNLFTLPIAEATSVETVAWLKKNKIQIVSASPHADSLYTDVDLTGPIAVVVGAEQYGLTDLWMKQSDINVRLPMLGEADSLNVATATALLLFEGVRQRMKAGIVSDPGAVLESSDC
ncbi:MAG: RNA methyltransferase [Lentisphaeria bacterium]